MSYYGFACIDNAGRVCGTPFPADGSAVFGARVVPLPLGTNGQPLGLDYPFGDYLSDDTDAPFVIIGAGSDANSYLIAEDGRICDLGPKGYSHQCCRLLNGQFVVAWYTLGGGYRLGVLDPITFTVTSSHYESDPTISAGMAGIDDQGQVIWTGQQPPTLQGIPCTRQIAAAGVVVAQANSGGVVEAKGDLAGVINPGVVTFEPMPSPNGRYYVARGVETMFTGPLPDVPPLSPSLPPVDLSPFPVFADRKWLAFWKSDTPNVNYGRVDSPTNAIIVEASAQAQGLPDIPCRRYDAALHGRQAIICGDLTAGVPPWNPETRSGLIAIPGSMEAGRFDLADVVKNRDRAIWAGVPQFVNMDATWLAHPDWIAAIESLRQPGDGWELWLMDELYPGLGEGRDDRYARWRRICTWHRDRFRATGRRWSVTVSCYPQAQPGPEGFPLPGVGYAIRDTQDNQRELATILAELGEGCALVMVFSDLRYGGMSWTYPDGSRPLYPFRQLWADANPEGADPILLISQTTINSVHQETNDMDAPTTIKLAAAVLQQIKTYGVAANEAAAWVQQKFVNEGPVVADQHGKLATVTPEQMATWVLARAMHADYDNADGKVKAIVDAQVFG